MKRFLTQLPFAVSLVLLAVLFYGIVNIRTSASNPTLSQHQNVLQQAWRFYKTHFLLHGQRSNYIYAIPGSLSEGQGYALLLAVWMNDEVTYKNILNWTLSSMQRQTDHLFAWHYGRSSAQEKDQIQSLDVATDGDQDIIYSLILASEQWNRPIYLQIAQPILKDFRKKLVRSDSRYTYLWPGTSPWFNMGDTLIAPSYYAPYIYPKFAQLEPREKTLWAQLRQDSYTTIALCSQIIPPDFPPDWCLLHPPSQKQPLLTAGKAIHSPADQRRFAYDSVRVFWRLYLDQALTASSQAQTLLAQHKGLRALWQKNKRFPDAIQEDGLPDKTLYNDGILLKTAYALQQASFNKKQGQQYFEAEVMKPYYKPEGYWQDPKNFYVNSLVLIAAYWLWEG
jgi:endo-1,4-beta-D-glucanase Y